MSSRFNVNSKVLAAAAIAAIAITASCGSFQTAKKPATTPTPGAETKPGTQTPAVAETTNPSKKAANATEPTPTGRETFATGATSPATSKKPAPARDEIRTPATGEESLTGIPGFELGNTASTRMEFDGTDNMRQVSDAAEGADFDPSISPDSKNVYFASTRHSSTSDIFVKAIDGSAITQLTSHPAEDVMPAISPDGKRIAFASNRNGSWDIFVMSTEGGQATQITTDSAAELHPSWSPDNDKLTFCRLNEASQRWEVWVTSANRPSFRQFITYGLFPAWQPGGGKIAFQRARERGNRFYSVWTVEYSGGEGRFPTEIASAQGKAITNPAWSPDGNLLACVSIANPSSTESGSQPDFADIWVVTADGRSKTNLTGGRFVNLMPVWGSGSSVFFASDRAGPRNIWSIDARQAMASAGITTGGSSTQAATHETPAAAATTTTVSRPSRTPRDAPRMAMPARQTTPPPAPASNPEHAAAPDDHHPEPTNTETTDAAPEHEDEHGHP